MPSQSCGKALFQFPAHNRANRQAKAGRVVVTEEGADYAQTIQAGPHLWRADELPDKGGGDKGPDPYELLLSSLGACTAITLRMYAQRKGWEPGRIKVELSHSKVHAEDCHDCELQSGQVDVIDRKISFAPPLARARATPGSNRRKVPGPSHP